MSSDAHWMLMASLPHLPGIGQARQLPIGQERLEARWQLLEAPTRQRWETAARLLMGHEAQPGQAGDEQLQAQWEAFQACERDPQVRQLGADLHLQRALVSALRCRAAGADGLPPALARALEPWALTVRRRWREPDFGLGQRMPWLSQARQLLETGDAPGLQRLLAERIWQRCERVRSRRPPSSAAMLAYRLQWLQLQAWLANDAARARDHLRRLAQAVAAAHGSEAPAGQPLVEQP